MNNHVLRALAALSLLVFGVVSAGTATADGSDPTLSLGTSRIAVDGNLQVNGSGFDPGASVDVRVCGVPGSDGLFTCSNGAENVVVSPTGSFVENFVVVAPTGKCPCVVKVAAADRPPVTVPIELIGHPVADRVETPQLVVDSASLEGGGGPMAWFAGSASPELVLTLRNAGVAPAEPTFQLHTGKADGSGTRTVVDDPGAAAIPPEGSAEVRVPVEVGGLTGGEFAVDGYVVVGDIYAPVHATTTVRPWGLYLLGLLAVVGAVAFVRARRRAGEQDAAPAASSHRGRQRSTPATAPAPVAVAAPAPVAAAAAAPVIRPRTAGIHLSDVARAAADAGRSVAAAALEKARAAEAQEAAEENANAFSESTAADIDARLDALAHDNLSRPERPQEPQAAPVAVEPEPEPRVKRQRRSRRRDADDGALVGPPRLSETPIDRSVLRTPEVAAEPAMAHALVSAPAPAPVEPEADDAVTAYLRHTSPQSFAPRVPRVDPIMSTLATAPLPVVVPPPLDLPVQPPTVPGQGGPSQAQFEARDELDKRSAQERRFQADLARIAANEAAYVSASVGAGVESLQGGVVEQPMVVAPQQSGAPSMAASLRSRAEQRDRAIVGDAMEAIRAHTAESPARLPDPHEFVPPQRDRRAPRGGKRAAR